MSQPLWYVRKQLPEESDRAEQNLEISHRASGPFPTPQVNEMLRLNELDLNDEVSLDGALWQSIRDSGHFGSRNTEANSRKSSADPSWQEEREKARLRWLEGAGNAEPAPLREPPQGTADSTVLKALEMEHARTRAMVEDNASRSPSKLIAVVAIVILALVGVGVWLGQDQATTSGKSIQAGLERKASNCTRPPEPGVSWAGCNYSSASLSGANLSNAMLASAQFVGTNLMGADLTYANIERANLQRANLENAQLLGANLGGANLSGANFRGADLRYAMLTGANVEGAQFEGATLVKATWTDGRVCAEGSIGACK